MEFFCFKIFSGESQITKGCRVFAFYIERNIARWLVSLTWFAETKEYSPLAVVLNFEKWLTMTSNTAAGTMTRHNFFKEVVFNVDPSYYRKLLDFWRCFFFRFISPFCLSLSSRKLCFEISCNAGKKKHL